MEEFILNTKTKYYNGWLINKEKELGMTSTEMASYLGISISYYSNIRAMRTYPKKSMIMGKICDKLGLNFDDTFPKWLDDNFIIKRDTVSEKEYKVNRISIENVKREELVSGNYDLEDEVAKKLLEEDVKKVLNTLDKRDRKVLEMRFGLNDYERTTLEEVARKLNVTRERVRQIEARALRRLRHPSRRIYLQQNNYKLK